MTTSRKRRRQCAKCPWRVDVDPRDIPNGYCEIRHAALRSTIAAPGSVADVRAPLAMMACHETRRGKELPCVGWLVNQVGPGNNLPLRLAVISGRVSMNVETVGDQHDTLEQTLPRSIQ